MQLQIIINIAIINYKPVDHITKNKPSKVCYLNTNNTLSASSLVIQVSSVSHQFWDIALHNKIIK